MTIGECPTGEDRVDWKSTLTLTTQTPKINGTLIFGKSIKFFGRTPPVQKDGRCSSCYHRRTSCPSSWPWRCSPWRTTALAYRPYRSHLETWSRPCLFLWRYLVGRRRCPRPCLSTWTFAPGAVGNRGHLGADEILTREGAGVDLFNNNTRLHRKRYHYRWVYQN